MTHTLDTFETALLRRLQQHLDDELEPAPARRSPWVRRSVAAAAVLIGAIGVLFTVPGIGTSPAYSVQEGNSGLITVEVRRLEDAQGLEADLAKHGVRADITYVTGGRQCAPGRYVPVDRKLSGMSVAMGSNLLRIMLPPGTVRSSETFVLAVSGQTVPAEHDAENGSEMFSGWADFDVTAGPVKACRVVTP